MTIYFFIFIGSLAGMLVIALKKIPALIKLPQNVSVKTIGVKGPFSDLQKGISSLSEKFSFERLLQKMLSKVRILTLKTDNRTSHWLERLREKSQKRKFGLSDNYWKEIKKMTKK